MVLTIWAGERGGGLISKIEFKIQSREATSLEKAGSKSNTAALENLAQFGERKKLKNRSQK